MRVRGSYEAIDEVEKRLKDYDHNPHFWRVFEADRTDDVSDAGDADMVTEFSGTCAWSVFSCMCKGDGTYANDHDGENTSLQETALELGCDIEVYSEEPGIGFAEHYLYTGDGKTAIEEEREYEEFFLDDSTFEEMDEQYGLTEKGLSESDFEDGVASIGGFEWIWTI